MTQMIAVDANALDTLMTEIQRLHARLDAVTIQPLPEWVTINEAAEIAGKNRKTIMRRIERGEIESKFIAGERMVRVNRGA